MPGPRLERAAKMEGALSAAWAFSLKTGPQEGEKQTFSCIFTDVV